jgi:hypothetical protein
MPHSTEFFKELDMELLDHYLQAVGFWLPQLQKRDIIAELSEDIRSQIEEKQGELGRNLDDAELEAILKRRGAPLLVAESYLPQRYLIGPLLFPIYRLVLKWALLYQAAGWFLVWIGFALLDRTHGNADPGDAVAGALRSFWLVGVNTFAAITATFALVERYHAKSRFLEQWNPRKLPRLRHPNQISRSNSAGELAWNGLLILWWVNLLRLPEIPGLRVALAPALLYSFYWPILTLFVALAAVACANLFRPWWTRRRAGVRIAINAFGLILIAVLFMTKPWFEVIAPHATTTEIRDIVQWVDWTAAVWLLVYAMSFVLRGIQDIRRLTGKEPIRHWAMRVLAGE